MRALTTFAFRVFHRTAAGCRRRLRAVLAGMRPPKKRPPKKKARGGARRRRRVAVLAASLARGGAFAIVLAFYRPRAWYVPVIVGSASSIAYLRYLQMADVSLTWGAILLGVLVAVLARRLFADLQAAPRGGARRRRRIAVLAASLARGGAERVALTFARGLAKRGHGVDLLMGEVNCYYPEEAADAAARNVRFFWVYPDTAGPEAARTLGGGAGRTWQTAVRPKVSAWRARFSRVALPFAAAPRQRPVLNPPVPERALLVAAYIDRERPDVLLAVNEHEAVSAALARRLARHPVRMVATLNNGLVNDRRIRNFRASYPFVDVAVGVSRGISGVLADVAGVPRGRVRTIHDPVFSPELLEKAVEPVSHPWLGGDVPVVLAAASLSPKKDYPTLLRAFSRLVSRRPARLVVLGEGVLLAKLRTQTEELGIDGQVDFAGFVRNPFAYMARADLFVLASRFEGLPGVLIQAMATGCPVVSTDCPHGPDEILEHGKYGPLVPVGDDAALAEAMCRTLDAPPDADALRSRAAVFSVERSIDAYEAVLAGGAPGAQ